MSTAWTFDFLKPKSEGTCVCCDQQPVRLKRHIYKDGEPFGVYYALYCNRQADREIDTLFTFGEWGEARVTDAGPAFHCRVRATGETYQVMLDDTVESAWSDSKPTGRSLSREEALEHPAKDQVLEILDEAMLRDPALNGYLQRCHAGEPAIPLEPSHDAPDVVLDLSLEERDERAMINQSFVVLDDKRYFVRCLIPLSVQNYGRWAPSIWVEVSTEEYQKVCACWEDENAYVQLRFEGKAANSLRTWGLNLPVGVELTLGVRDSKESPNALSSTHSGVNKLMKQEWSQSRFDLYAVSITFCKSVFKNRVCRWSRRSDESFLYVKKICLVK